MQRDRGCDSINDEFFERPAQTPKYGLGFDTWWVDEAKAARLSAARRGG